MHDIATRSPYTGLSTFFIDEHADEIALLTGRLSLTPLQAVFISLFYRWRHAPVDLCKLYDHTCTYYLRWNDSHFDAVDTLGYLGYLEITVIDRRDHYRLNPDALKSILRGEPYRPDQVKETNLSDNEDLSLRCDTDKISVNVQPTDTSQRLLEHQPVVLGFSLKSERIGTAGRRHSPDDKTVRRNDRLPHFRDLGTGQRRYHTRSLLSCGHDCVTERHLRQKFSERNRLDNLKKLVRGVSGQPPDRASGIIESDTPVVQ